jgi:hypothetical protein
MSPQAKRLPCTHWQLDGGLVISPIFYECLGGITPAVIGSIALVATAFPLGLHICLDHALDRDESVHSNTGYILIHAETTGGTRSLYAGLAR